MVPLIDPQFATSLGGYDVPALERDPCVIYGVDAELRIGFVNEAFARFWRANGGEGPAERWVSGRCVLDAISGPLRDYYGDAFHEALRLGTTWAHVYECHSPTRFRRFRMEVLPLHQGRGLLVVNSRIEEREHDLGEEVAGSPYPAKYVRPDGYLLQCSNCRRVRLVGSEPPRWDWVPGLVEGHHEHVSHGICRLCVGQYYGEYLRARD